MRSVNRRTARFTAGAAIAKTAMETIAATASAAPGAARPWTAYHSIDTARIAVRQLSARSTRVSIHRDLRQGGEWTQSAETG